MATFVTNLDIFNFLKNSGCLKNSDLLFQTIIKYIPSEIPNEELSIIKKFCQNYTSNLARRWEESSRNEHFGESTKNKKWLESKIVWPTSTSVNFPMLFDPEVTIEDVEVEEEHNLSYEEEAGASTSKAATNTPRSRNKRPFEDLTNKQKKRRSLSLLEHSEEELFCALATKLKENGRTVCAKVIKCLSNKPEKVQEVSDFLFKDCNQSIPEEETLALVTALSLSKWQYLTLRSILNTNGIAAFPSYHKLLLKKKECYPAKEDINISESGAKIKLQAVLDLTAEKIVKVTGSSINKGVLKLVSKWGCDGASSQSCYKQKPTGDIFSESSVFMVSFVPLRLMSDDVIVWENPRPSSTSYCRPIMFEFKQETKEYIQQVEATIEEEIQNLIPTKILNGEFEVFHELHMTMIDGKVCTALSETDSAANCNICLTTPKDMNNLNHVFNKPVNDDMYKYGLSSLHMWLRCMECILHISYNLDFKKWAARGGENKLLRKTRKELTQNEFFVVTGLMIDIVKQGFGTTNDGNTARRFFKDYERSSEITGVNSDLIKRFAVILQAISSGRNVDIERFRMYCRETAELYVRDYSWYYMPSSVHKLLVHGADICQHFSFIPIGMMSEEASEARNKDFRSIREKHTRKIGRVQTNEDIIHQLLISSDPYITNIRPKFTEIQKQQRFEETENLLKDDSPNDLGIEVTEEEEVYVDIEINPLQDPLQ